MILIGILSLIIYSSHKEYTIKEIKEFISSSILLIIYSIIILWNSISYINIGKGISLLNNNLLLTSYTVNIKILLLIVLIIYLILLYHYFINNNNNYNNNPGLEYIILIILNIFAMLLFIESGNSLMIFITIELQSYTLYIITTSYYNINNNNINNSNNNNSGLGIYSAKSGLIYFLLGSLASILILIGLAIIYKETGLYNITDIIIYINYINSNNNNLIFGILFILLGLMFKIGLAPLHNWLINIYNNVPTIVTIWISLVTKISIFTFIYSILHLFNILYLNNNIILNILQIIAIISMIIGGIGGLSQISLKKLLAYSGLANSGYILFSLLSNNQYTLLAFIFNIYQYSLTHLNIFLIIILTIIYSNNYYNNNNINNTNNNIKQYIYINNLYNFVIKNRSLTLCYIITLTSFMGIPPLIGFYGKYFVLISGLLSGYWFTSLILILVSCLTAYYYGYIIKTLIFNLNNDNNIDNNNIINNNINNYKSINISYILSYMISLITLLILIPLLVLDIYINGSVIIDSSIGGII